jgi:hypothetical protein
MSAIAESVTLADVHLFETTNRLFAQLLHLIAQTLCITGNRHSIIRIECFAAALTVEPQTRRHIVSDLNEQIFTSFGR